MPLALIDDSQITEIDVRNYVDEQKFEIALPFTRS